MFFFKQDLAKDNEEMNYIFMKGISAGSLGIKGSELNSELAGKSELKNKLVLICRKASVLSSLTSSEEEVMPGE